MVSLLTIFLALFYLLGLALGPLVLAVATRAYSEGRGRRIGDWSFATGLKSVWRPALTFNAANELELKRRGYDEEHDEQKISFGGLFSKVERFLFDPQNRIHDFYGTPFAFVDERFGIILDPRDAVLGRELLERQAAGTYTRRVERGEQLVESVLAVFELPKGHVGARLPDVWALVGGSFDAQLVRKIHEFYRKGQAPKSGTTAIRQLLVPVGAFIGVLLLGMLAAGQGVGQGGGGGGASVPNSSSIEIGGSMLLLWATLRRPAVAERIRSWLGNDQGHNETSNQPSPPQTDGGADGPRPDRGRVRDWFVSAVFLGVFGLLAYGLYVALPVPATLLGITLPLGLWGVVLLTFGMGTLPFVAGWFGRGLGPIGAGLGKIFIIIGLLPYARPVITLIDERTYELREYAAEDWPVEPQWYRFALTRVGVGFLNDEGTWSDDLIESPAAVGSMGEAVTDGGGDLVAAAEAPPKHAVTPLIEQEGIYGYVPTDVDDDAVYVRTDLTTGWFEEAGQNRRLMQAALETAKERFGGGQKPLSDNKILMATFAAMIAGAIFDWLVFF